ncbi:DUF3592 domain-containing protein [Kitasatospora sp. NPDC008050]|uniref:DUF3592 domain-containing protein n=1 Tax=Kitasatospora sp. NPDC008050 TaxID=3364021 RepID=UPI0036EE36E8
MTTIEDERPPTPEDRRLPAALADGAHPPRRTRGWARGTVRTLQGLAGAAVLVGALVTAFARWGSDTWYAGWVGAGIAAALMALAAPVRLLLAGSPGGVISRLSGNAMLALLLAVFAGLFAFGVSGWCHEHDRDQHATLRVSATVTDCRSGPDSGIDCAYHWSVAGRAYSSRAGASDLWPDGHRVSVRIDPVHPERSVVTGGGYWAWWFAVGIGALGTPLALGAWWLMEVSTDD